MVLGFVDVHRTSSSINMRALELVRADQGARALSGLDDAIAS